MSDAAHDRESEGTRSTAATHTRPSATERWTSILLGVGLTSGFCLVLLASALHDAALEGEDWDAMSARREAAGIAASVPMWVFVCVVASLPSLPALFATNTRRSVPLVGIGTCALMVLLVALGETWSAAIASFTGGIVLLFVARRRFALPPEAREPWGDLP